MVNREHAFLLNDLASDILLLFLEFDKIYSHQFYLAGNCFAKSLTSSKYSAVLWIGNSKFLILIGLFSDITSMWSVSKLKF